MARELPGQLALWEPGGLDHVVSVVHEVHGYEIETRRGVYEKRSLTWSKWVCSCGRSAHDAAWSHDEIAMQMGFHHAEGEQS